MKQTIVIKVQMNCKKWQKKAMKLAASADGVNSVALQDDDHLVVVGDGVDSVCLAYVLRKKLGYAEITKVEEVKKAEDEMNETEKEKPEVNYYCTPNNPWHPQVPHYYPLYSQAVVCDSGSYPDSSSCSIM